VSIITIRQAKKCVCKGLNLACRRYGGEGGEMGKDDVTIESAIKTVESMLGIDEKQPWAYQRLEEAIERLKPHINELDEHSKGIFKLGVLELDDAAQAGEQW
jgi:hypothetical protein